MNELESNNIFENTKTKIDIIFIIILCVLSVSVSIYAISEIDRLEELLSSLNDEPVAEDTIGVVDIENEVFSIDKRQYDSLLNSIDMLELQHSIENGGIVTNDFIVDKIKIYNLENLKEGTDIEELSMYIDLDSQPSMSRHYEGNGKFDLSDRELKVAVSDILESIKVKWDRNFRWNIDKDYNKFEEGTHYVTYKNYEVGTVENGEFILIGE